MKTKTYTLVTCLPDEDMRVATDLSEEEARSLIAEMSPNTNMAHVALFAGSPVPFSANQVTIGAPRTRKSRTPKPAPVNGSSKRGGKKVETVTTA